MLIQLVNTFVAGVFFATTYNYTKNITLLVLVHAMWDYVLFTDVSRTVSFVGYAYVAFMALEFIIAVILLIKYKKEEQLSSPA